MRAKIFTLDEANRLLPEIIELTQHAVTAVERARAQAQFLSELDEGSRRESLEHEIDNILRNWARQISELGVFPKGFFTCDFQSPKSDTYFCWTFGEQEIAFVHRVDQTFKDRVPLEDAVLNGYNISLN